MFPVFIFITCDAQVNTPSRCCYPHFTYRETEGRRDLVTCSGSCPGPVLSLSDRRTLLLGPKPKLSPYTPSWEKPGTPHAQQAARAYSPHPKGFMIWKKGLLFQQGSQGPSGHRNHSSGPARERTAKPRDSCQVIMGYGVHLSLLAPAHT